MRSRGTRPVGRYKAVAMCPSEGARSVDPDDDSRHVAVVGELVLAHAVVGHRVTASEVVVVYTVQAQAELALHDVEKLLTFVHKRPIAPAARLDDEQQRLEVRLGC